LYDIIVSGAGPAGSYSAYLCAKSGLRTLLLERSILPRKKCCAGGVLERAVRLLDFDYHAEVIERELKGFHFVREGKQYQCKNACRLAVTVRREVFDADLVRKAESAGAEFMQETEVIKIGEASDRVKVVTSRGDFDSRFVFIAEGANSRNAKTLLGSFTEGGMSLGVAAEIQTVEDPGESAGIYLFGSGKILPFRGGFPTTGATFPLRSSVMASAVAAGKDTLDLRLALELIKRDVSEKLGVVKMHEQCFHSVPLAPRTRLVTRRVLAIGDSAGFVSPFSGEGLTYALTSAVIAAKVIAAQSQLDGNISLRDYEVQCNRQIISRMRAARLIGPILHWVVGNLDSDRVLGNLTKDPEAIDLCARLARGSVSLRDFALKGVPRIPHLMLSNTE
jgi:geranylgeranyl reductase family protein